MRKSYADLREEIDYDNLTGAMCSDFSEVPDYRASNVVHKLDDVINESDPVVRKLKKRLRSARAAHMEGATGNEKLHYGLNRIKATHADTQKLWIHFGV